MINLLREFRERATELICLGDPMEKATGSGILEVLNAIESAPPTYLLFGGDAIRMMDNDSPLTEVGEKINAESIGEIATFDLTDSVDDILDRASGWGDYAILTKEQYNTIDSKLV